MTGEAAGIRLDLVERRTLVPALAMALVLLALASLAVGPAALSLREVLDGILSGNGVAGIVVRDIRLPRTLLAMMVGGTLGLSGAALQGLLRNPLADPALFGAPQSAALGAVIVLYAGLGTAYSWALPWASIAGALASVALVVTVAGRSGGVTTLVLAGLAVSSLAGALTSIAINLSPNPYAVTEIVFWLLGSFEDRSMQHVLLAAPFCAVGAALIASQSEPLRALSLGEEAASSLGTPVIRVRLILVAAVAIGIGGAVAVSGAIGFVGLVAPHLVRRAVGYDPARVLLPSALSGACLMLAADMACRLIPAGTELKVGAVTALIGVPVFLWIVGRHRATLMEGGL